MPVNELVRLVHLYSTPWEEKSTALKKLHEDYEAKKTQLNIALKRLEMVDAYVSSFGSFGFKPFINQRALHYHALSVAFCDYVVVLWSSVFTSPSHRFDNRNFRFGIDMHLCP